MTTGLSESHRATIAAFRFHAYLSNGWDAVKRWDGRATSVVSAGIAGPSRVTGDWAPTPTTGAGSLTAGIHRFRYRYLDSVTGYVSDPSNEYTATVASGAQQLTFAINTSGAGNMIRSTDTKVDRIVVEATTVNGSVFYKAAETAQTASSVAVSVADANLLKAPLLWADDGHTPPPLGKYVVSHGGRLWIFGQVEHSTGTVDVTNSSVNVPQNGAAGWTTDALGTSGVPPFTGRRFLQVGMDTAVYEISYYDLASTRLILVTAYAGSTATNQTYRIFSKVNAVYVSSADNPESFHPLSNLPSPEGELAGEITAGVGWGDRMVFFTRHTSYVFTWNQEPSEDGFRLPIPGQRGALSQRVVVTVDGALYALDRKGVWAFTGSVPIHLSRPIDSILEDLDYTQSENWHACFYPRQRVIRWFVTEEGTGTYPTYYVEWDVERKQWGAGRLDVGISESRLVPTQDGLRVYLGDENGHVWVDDEGTCDGCHEDYSHLTVGASSTTTVVTVTNVSLATANEGVAGVYAYWVEGGEGALVASNTDATLTLATALSGAPAEGDTVWLGRILAKLKTKAFLTDMGECVNTYRALHLGFDELDEDRGCFVRCYEDYSSTAQGWGEPDDRENPRGLTFPGKDADWPDEDWIVDLSAEGGVVRIPLGTDTKRALEVEIEVQEPDTPLQITYLGLDGLQAEPL